MKYNAKQLPNGNWAVFTGKKYWPNTETANKEDANTAAEYKSALFLIKEAAAILEKSKMDFRLAQQIGGEAVAMVDTVTAITRKQDPDFDEMDSLGWTC